MPKIILLKKRHISSSDKWCIVQSTKLVVFVTESFTDQSHKYDTRISYTYLRLSSNHTSSSAPCWENKPGIYSLRFNEIRVINSSSDKLQLKHRLGLLFDVNITLKVRSVLRRQSRDTNRNTKRSVYCQYG